MNYHSAAPSFLADQFSQYNPDLIDLRLDFSSQAVESWRRDFAKISRSNLLQSYDYALAMAEEGALRPSWAYIYCNDVKAGMVQILIASALHQMLQAVIIDRGPLWFDGFGTPAQQLAFWQKIQSKYPPRLGRRRRFIPECHFISDVHRQLIMTGFRQARGKLPYETIWLDLTVGPEKLREGLRKNWRYSLGVAEKEDLNFHIDHSGQMMEAFLYQVAVDQRQRGYRGPGVQQLARLIRFFGSGDGCYIAQVSKNHEVLAYGLFLRHGSSATYQSGWVSPMGRRVHANNLLLWRAVLYLAQGGVSALDLGGVNGQDAAGIQRFKEGLGGEHVVLSGVYS